MSPNNVIKPRGGFKPAAWTLFISVLLNLFLAGAFLGVMPHEKHRPFGPMGLAAPHGEYLAGWMERYLDPKDAVAFRDAFDAEADALKKAHDHVHDAINNLATVFEQDPPDAAALQAALDRMAQARAETNEVVGKILQSAYAKMSADGRRRLSDLSQTPL
jgi:uncharacterized membrane protein